MLKKEYDIIYKNMLNWIFNKYLDFAVSSKYGEITIKEMPAKESFMEIEVLTFVSNANKRRNPNSQLLIPACINVNDLNVIISKVKTNFI